MSRSFQHTIDFFYLFTGVKHSPLAVLCRSCIATPREADCHTAYHTWYTCSTRQEKNSDFQLLALYDVITKTQLIDRDLLDCPKLSCDAAEECV